MGLRTTSSLTGNGAKIGRLPENCWNGSPRTTSAAATCLSRWAAEWWATSRDSSRAYICAGLSYIQVPTTLLAAIDSSVGGKTAVDLEAGKNLAGRIHPPSAVICDLDMLSTLPRSEWKCGIGEAVKYAVLDGGEIFDIMSDGVDDKNLERLVDLCIESKKRIVEADENENGVRRLLNLGHTVGHAIETESALGFPHGVCVAMGIKVIAKASVRAGYLPKEDYMAIAALLQKYGFPDCPYPLREVLVHTAHDKKIAAGRLNAVVIRGIGKCEVVPMSADEFAEFVS